MANSMAVPKKLKVELSYDPAVPLLDIYLEKMKTLIWKDTCTPMFIAPQLTIAKTKKQPKYSSTDKWIKKTWDYSPIKKEWNSSICSNADREYYA